MSPLACSLAAHIACLEAGLPVTLHRVDLATKRLEDGRDYLTLVPLGNVPALEWPDGGVLVESTAVLQYIADRVPASNLAPAWGTAERYRLLEWLNFVSSEVHKRHTWKLFASETTPELVAWSRAHATPVLRCVERHLTERTYLVGEHFTVADAYLFWTLLVLPHGGVALDAYPALRAYAERIQRRPSVQQALAIELPMYQREKAAKAS